LRTNFFKKISNNSIIFWNHPWLFALLKPVFLKITTPTDTVSPADIFITSIKCMYTLFLIKSISTDVMFKYNHIHSI
jgi:hypothetical protein